MSSIPVWISFLERDISGEYHIIVTCTVPSKSASPSGFISVWKKKNPNDISTLCCIYHQTLAPQIAFTFTETLHFTSNEYYMRNRDVITRLTAKLLEDCEFGALVWTSRNKNGVLSIIGSDTNETELSPDGRRNSTYALKFTWCWKRVHLYFSNISDGGFEFQLSENLFRGSWRHLCNHQEEFLQPNFSSRARNGFARQSIMSDSPAYLLETPTLLSEVTLPLFTTDALLLCSGSLYKYLHWLNLHTLHQHYQWSLAVHCLASATHNPFRALQPCTRHTTQHSHLNELTLVTRKLAVVPSAPDW